MYHPYPILAGCKIDFVMGWFGQGIVYIWRTGK